MAERTTDELADALIKSLQKKLWVAVALAMLAAGSSVLNLVSPDMRAQSFTSNDGRIMKLETIQECKDYVDEYFRPPVPTRIRIEALEQSCERTDPEYNKPTDEWQ